MLRQLLGGSRPCYRREELLGRARAGRPLSSAALQCLLERGCQELHDGSWAFTYDFLARATSVMQLSEEQLVRHWRD